ncbi:glyoxalase superfamily protein [Pelagibius sp. CAU 1746]|uniref:glyoxalase superfamily protein n=1 Tax=Pelagibius sp. CAU 1746 TaxID=3140370 RepID=UPI00325BAFD1
MKLSTPVPILRIFDEAKAKEFYVDWLGFAVDWEHRFEANLPLYMQVSKDGCLLHLSEHHGDSTPGARLRIECDDIDRFAAWLQARPYNYARPGDPEQMPWGTREITLSDPFGNRLTFSSPVA